MRRWEAFALVLILAAGFVSCSQMISVPPPSVPSSAEDFFWQPAQLTLGINYYVLRAGTGSDHLLSSTDGNHIEDGALNNEVTMIVHASMDSVLIDSMGMNSIFSLPMGYYFRADSSAPDILVHDTVVHDTLESHTVVIDTVVKDTSGNVITERDTVIRDTMVRDTMAGRLLLLLRTAMDSGRSWQAGMLFGPGIPNGVPVIATVLDHVNSLRLPPVNAGADSAFGESFRIRYAPENFSDSVSTFPIYWIAYFSRNIGPVLIQQYTLGFNGKYAVTDSVQIIRQAP